MKKTGIFEVDTHGMGAQARERGLGRLLLELYSNAVDERVHKVFIKICPTGVRGRYEFTVEDDSPDGFRNLWESYTLYSPSYKRDNPEQRGRFNTGEKHVIAACERAEIVSTTGRVTFDDTGRHVSRHATPAGTIFTGIIRTNQQEVADAVELLRRVIVPDGVTFRVNGLEVPHREPVATIDAFSLPTMLPGDEGVMRPTQRQTTVRLYAPLPDTVPGLFELGVPVVDTGDGFDIDVAQKVPLNQDRDNVTPSYLARIRAVALNAAVESGELDIDHVSETWVKEAAGHKLATTEAVREVMDLRFGKKRVSYDLSDSEANKRAVENGYRLVYGPNLSKDEWANVRRAEAIVPAGQRFPSGEWAYSDDPDAPDEKVIPESSYTPGMHRIVAHAHFLGRELLGQEIRVRLVNEPINRADALAAYGPSGLIFNMGRLGRAWFNHAVSDPAVSDILIHEFAHHYSEDHLSRKYHDALSNLGARMVKLALDQPDRWGE